MAIFDVTETLGIDYTSENSTITHWMAQLNGHQWWIYAIAPPCNLKEYKTQYIDIKCTKTYYSLHLSEIFTLYKI